MIFQGTRGVRVLLPALALFLAGSVHSQDPGQPRQLVLLDVPAPALTGGPADWMNTGGQPVAFEKGRVYLVHFWAFGCVNCKRNLPAYAAWQAGYSAAPFTVVGVHTPETSKERDPKNLAAAVQEHGITYPVLVDGKSANWKRWQQQVWPTVYLVDKRGHVRAYWVGELEWENAGGTRIMDGILRQLLNEPAPAP